MKSVLGFFSLMFFLNSSLTVSAQYYNSAFGKNGAVLKTALHNIIKGHTVGTYADLWTDYFTTDNKGGNILWDIYSDIPGGTAPYTFTLGIDQCGSAGYNSEGDCYNREHVWPSTYFGDGPPMYTDIQQIYPTDGWVNNKHGNLPYGKVNTSTWVSQNGCKLGTSTTYSGSSLDVFEPIDSFKGDIARVYFYMSTRYESEDAGWSNWEMANGAVLTPEAITLLLSWHHLDPVSQKEISRNNAAFAIQGNRNPFIDYPQFADCIWGSADCTSLAVGDVDLDSEIKIYPNPVERTLHVDTGDPISISSYSLIDITGQEQLHGTLLNHEVTIQALPKGVYLLRMNTNKGIAKKMIVKE